MSFEEFSWLLLGGVLGVGATVIVVGLPDIIHAIREHWRGELARRAKGDGWPPL